MSHSEFKNSAIAKKESITPKLVMVGLTLVLLAANVYYFTQAIH